MSSSILSPRDNEAMTSPHAEYPGDPEHPDHTNYLQELGQATYAAAELARIAFDMLRVHRGIDSSLLYNDPLGALENRLKRSHLSLDGIDEFITLLDEARETRNNLIHALPITRGLQRRTNRDLSIVRNFYTTESLREAREMFDKAMRKGNEVLYSDGGAALKKWCGAPEI